LSSKRKSLTAFGRPALIRKLAPESEDLGSRS
jgi:hypothetical protein